MNIKRLYIENYKSLKEVNIELNEDVNVFIGKNNSGKSNIIDALMFLSDIVGKNVRNALDERGEYKDIVFGKNVENEIIFDIEFAISDKEMLTLFSKLRLEPEISLDEFKKSILNKARYFVKLEEEHTLLQEEVYIYPNENEILYAKGFWKENGMYERQIIENFKEGIKNGNWNLTSYGASSPPTSVLYAPFSHSPIKPEENLFLLFHNFVTSFEHLNPVRDSPESLGVYGVSRLKPDASNLPQVLNSIASSNRGLFDTIIKSAGEIIEEISEIRAPLIEATQNTYLSVVESPFKNIEFTWKHIASGTKETLYLITLLHTTPKRTLLMIEEPEIHLHPDAIHKFLSLIEKICREDEKQILITTHSPILIDASSFDRISIVTKRSGITHVKSFKEFTDIEKKLVKQGILKSWLLLHQAKSLPFAKFVLITEGKDDVKVWKKFIEKSNLFSNLEEIKVIRGTNGGWTKAIKITSLLKLVSDLGILSLPFMVVLDSDNMKDEKTQEVQKASLSPDSYHILEGEIEDHLLDSTSILKVTGKATDEVDKAISDSRSSGKEKLTNVFKNLGFSEPSGGIKELLVANMDDIPDEISEVLKKCKEKM